MSELIERVARIIADAMGDNYSDAFKNKERWIAKRGMSGGRFREVNEPMQCDYLAAAQAAIAAVQADAAPAICTWAPPCGGMAQNCSWKPNDHKPCSCQHPPVDNRVSTSSPVDDRAAPETSVKLRDAVEVWEDAYRAWDETRYPFEREAAAAVIEADREAVRAEQAAELSKLREDLRAERLKPCRHTRTALAETRRPDIQAWQEAQSEWFDPTILGIVSEYAAYRDQVEAAELASIEGAGHE